MTASSLDQLAEILTVANYVITFTGAGISTESGIPDFRSSGDGLWEKIDPEMLSVRTLRSDPALFYRYFRVMDRLLTDKQPNRGHQALVELSKLRVIRAVITQNIDGLHQKAGSRRVFEVHGNLDSSSCLNCKSTFAYSLIGEKIAAGAAVPLSPCCGAVLRPDVVLFGDKMPAAFTVAREEAFRSDFALVVGTSLTVYPAAEIPLAARRFAIINRDETEQDRHAVLTVRDAIGQVLTELVERVGAKRKSQ